MEMEYILIGDNKQEDFTSEIFINRGIKAIEIPKYLRTTDDVINDYKDLDNIERAASILEKHIKSNNNVLFIVDSDVDGYTSSAIVWNYIDEYMGGKYDNLYFINHEGKQHGFALETLDVAWGEYDLVIAPDGGTNDHKEHKILSEEYGLEIIVLDHHDASEGYSDYACVVNSQLSENFDNKMLSGAGIAWNFIKCHNDLYGNGEIDTDKYLDIVGLGNVADMMSLQELETKHLINKGFEEVYNPFFKAAFEKQNYSMKGNLNPTSVSWYIAPLINAVTRVGEQHEKDLMFQAFLNRNDGVEVASTKRGAKAGDTEILSEQAVRVASNVKNRQARIVDEGMELIQTKIKEGNLNDNKILIVTIAENDIAPEIVGLVANKIASEYQQPTLIGRDLGDIYSGSGRNSSYSKLEDFRGYLEETGLVIFAAGHDSAFGWAVKKENLVKLIEKSNRDLDYLENTKAYRVDFEFDADTDTEKLLQYTQEIDSFNELGIWGVDMSEPLVAVKNVSTENLKLMGKHKNTIKIEADGVEYMKFFTNEEEAEKIRAFGNIDIVGSGDMNKWGGRSKPQIIIDGLRPSREEESLDRELENFFDNF